MLTEHIKIDTNDKTIEYFFQIKFDWPNLAKSTRNWGQNIQNVKI